MIRNKLIALVLAHMFLGSSVLLLGQTEFRRPVTDDPTIFSADSPKDRDEPVPLPVPTAPPNNSKGRNPHPVLEVSVPSTIELLNFTVYPAGGDEPAAAGYTTGRCWPVQPLHGDMLAPGFYNWTCRAWNGQSWSDFFAPAWCFEVEKVGPDSPLDDIGRLIELPPAPTPVSPPNRTKGRNGTITLVVDSPIDCDEYHFRVSSGNSGHCVWDGFTTNREWQVPRFPVNVYGTFNWTCRARLGHLWSVWFTPEWNFEIENPFQQLNGELGIATSPVRSVTASPNPTRAGSEVWLALVRDCYVSAAVYDAQGALIRTLAAGQLAEGNHSLFWNGRDDLGRRVGAGTYLCRITADNTSDVVRITISR